MALQQNFHDGISHFIHQESLNEDVQNISEILGIHPPVSVEKVNVTNAMPPDMTYHDYYDDELRNLVLHWNGPTFELFPEYDFEGFNPNNIGE